MSAKKIALFIDADNISSKFGKNIFDALENRGEIFIRRIYGNWEKNILHGWNECILNFSLRAVQQPDFVTGKNATDMSLTIDAMDILHEGKAEIFALVSNDSDFTPLAIRLREGGMNVVGLGNSNVSNSFRAACSEFINLGAQSETKSISPTPKLEKKIPPAQEKNQPVQLSLFSDEKFPTAEKIPPTSSKVVPITAPKMSLQERFMMCGQNGLRQPKKKFQQIHNILRESATVHGDENGFSDLSYAGNSIGEKNLGFGIKDFGYNQLREFIVDFPDLYETAQIDKKFFYRCRTIGQKNSFADDRLRQIHDVIREAATVYGDDTGFSLLNYAGQALKQKNLGFGIKDFGYNQLRDFVADFPNLYETIHDETGQHFRYRCRAI